MANTASSAYSQTLVQFSLVYKALKSFGRVLISQQKGNKQRDRRYLDSVIKQQLVIYNLLTNIQVTPATFTSHSLRTVLAWAK